MTRSKKLFAAFALVGIGGAIAGTVAAPFNQSAAAGYFEADVASARIEAAFALVTPQIVGPAAVAAAKGDLPPAPGCTGQTWPNISSDCLVTADGARPPKARMVTVGHQSGEAETVLVRLPLAEIAMR
ncbi:MAG: hypothetical protein ACRED5_22595 [Propylenella sp.]